MRPYVYCQFPCWLRTVLTPSYAHSKGPGQLCIDISKCMMRSLQRRRFLLKGWLPHAAIIDDKLLYADVATTCWPRHSFVIFWPLHSLATSFFGHVILCADVATACWTNTLLLANTLLWSNTLLCADVATACWTKTLSLVELARAVYTRRIWPYIWWFPCQKCHI
jgi:hypothetical protein